MADQELAIFNGIAKTPAATRDGDSPNVVPAEGAEGHGNRGITDAGGIFWQGFTQGNRFSTFVHLVSRVSR